MKFLKKIDRETPKDKTLHLIADNYATHKTPQVKRWLKRHPRDPQLLLSLGRLCVQSQLWGKAESYLDASLAILPGWEAHVELGRLAERIGRTDDANRHYRAAAELSRR